MLKDNYTTFMYDEKLDLDKTDYWIYCAADTPPGRPRTPMFDWVFMNSSNWGANYACYKISIPSANSIAFRSYNGYGFMTVTLPASEDEVKRRSAKFKTALGYLIQNYDQLWAEAKLKLIGYTKKPKEFDFDNASWFEMSQLFRDRMSATRKMYEIVYYFSEGLGTTYLLFVDLCKNMLGIDESEPLFRKLFTGLQNATSSTSLVEKGLHRLSQRANELGLANVLIENKPEEVVSQMERTESGQLWNKELIEFLNIHGWRCLIESDYITPTWVEEPSLAIVHIQQYLNKGPDFELDLMIEREAKERENVEKELIEKVPLDQRDWFETLLRIAQQFTIWRLEHIYYCEVYQHAITRHVLMQIGTKISKVECIERAEDIFFLVPEELYKALIHPESCSLKPLVRNRKTKWEENKKIIPPPLFSKIDPDQAANLFLKSKDPMAIELAIGMTSLINTKHEVNLGGQIASMGIAEGPARVILSAEQLGEIQEGDILVAPIFRSSWSPVFPLIKGAVIDRGGILSDAAILGREYGIPVITNVIDGSLKIKTGQRIKIDDSLGAVLIVSPLEGKKLLIVDDEADILDTLEDLLPMCELTKADTFQKAKTLLENEQFDLAILDIMGVKGYDLLAIAKKEKVMSVMLTAHALSLDSTVRAYKEGAVCYVPKEKCFEIEDILIDIFESKGKQEFFWSRWLDRFGPFYDSKFGLGWQNKHKEFWEIFKKTTPLDL
ncbi:PEP-utilizing enzyme [Desulfobacula sp.]|uniref:PEP-utilizing enzyme n=1 Tax=Desulfobacula sp. TaxID=2593537 RepID=UPI0026289287|nr:PEP-utilizing enzyme [Desulfobacula sp.]